jgi:hypothetical protein
MRRDIMAGALILRRRGRAILAVAVLLVGARCGRTAPTEPVPVDQLAGLWTGTMSGCGSISASVAQYGTAVTITLTTDCAAGNGVSFQGSLNGEAIRGTLARRAGPLCPRISGPSSGTATASRIQLTTDRVPGTTPTAYWTCPGIAANTIELARQERSF